MCDEDPKKLEETQLELFGTEGRAHLSPVLSSPGYNPCFDREASVLRSPGLHQRDGMLQLEQRGQTRGNIYQHFSRKIKATEKTKGF